MQDDRIISKYKIDESKIGVSKGKFKLSYSFLQYQYK